LFSIQQSDAPPNVDLILPTTDGMHPLNDWNGNGLDDVLERARPAMGWTTAFMMDDRCDGRPMRWTTDAMDDRCDGQPMRRLTDVMDDIQWMDDRFYDGRPMGLTLRCAGRAIDRTSE
jgi:hypothetical protein